MTESARVTAAASIIGAVLAVGIGLAALIIATSGRLSARLTAVERERARASGLLEGLGFTGRASSSPSGVGD